MNLIRAAGAAMLAGALTLGVQGAATVAAAPAAAAGYQDCFTPGVDPNLVISTTHSDLTFRTSTLRCGRGGETGFGVLHINEGHPPFNDTTVRCIEHVLATAPYELPATGEDNVMYRRSTRDMDAVVIVNADTNNVVTAYTSRGGTSASNEWEACTQIT
jgi:hypothetical protein